MLAVRATIARMEKRPKTTRAAMSLRLPIDVHAEIQEAAALAGRSMNDEIIWRLRAYAQATTLNEIAQQNAELKKMMQQLIDRST